jgi:hypothetical protein
VAARPLKNNNNTTTTTPTTKLFADIVQKTQTKPPFDNRNFSFPKSATKKIDFFFQILQKDLYQSRRGEKTDQFLLQKIGFFFPGVREQCKKIYAKRFRATRAKPSSEKRPRRARLRRARTQNSRKPSFTQLFLIFFSLLPGDSNLTDCRDPRAQRFSMPRVKIWGRENLLTCGKLGSQCHPF